MNEVGGRLEVQNTMFALGTHAPTVHAKARPGKDPGKHQTNARIHYDRLPDHTLLQLFPVKQDVHIDLRTNHSGLTPSSSAVLSRPSPLSLNPLVK
jgi:hypothetical protein